MRMIGTGKDPLARYPKGVLYDIPDSDEATIADHIARGWGRPDDEPSRTDVQIANAIIRGDPLLNKNERKIAQRIKDRTHAIAHTSDPSAKSRDAHP